MAKNKKKKKKKGAPASNEEQFSQTLRSFMAENEVLLVDNILIFLQKEIENIRTLKPVSMDVIPTFINDKLSGLFVWLTETSKELPIEMAYRKKDGRLYTIFMEDKLPDNPGKGDMIADLEYILERHRERIHNCLGANTSAVYQLLTALVENVFKQMEERVCNE